MSAPHRLVSRSSPALRRTSLILARHASSKQQSAYPFTKSNDATPQPASKTKASGPSTPYPFTSPTGPTTPPPPTRPTPNAGPVVDESAMISRAAGENNEDGHHIDLYNHMADYRTSAFSPMPSRVMDGSEDTTTTPAAVLSGAPTELQARSVRIYRPAKTATQSGDWHGHHWRMDWDVLHKGHRWENPLMGWQSSADAMQGTHLNFKSREDAIRFADKQGYPYYVQEPNERKRVVKAYATQFLYTPGKLKNVRTK